ncbi:MAG: Crp/Fnr family transcriptional regulator [Caldilineales bacterium]|nr:Crp/Fnr family transcriptional regulator [Caldilineales bacterium]MCW5859397.1 Crp/Fnr family transcriptional regulator [Caldilineales bacterium]
MISPEIIRRYPFFAGFTYDDTVKLANVAEEMHVEAGYCFFHENELLAHIYFALEGAVGVVMELPAPDVEHPVSDQFTGQLKTQDVVVSPIGPGELFGWSALVPPCQASAGAKALTACRVLAFDAARLNKLFAEDCRFGYLMMQKLADVIRARLRDLRIESLALAV